MKSSKKGVSAIFFSDVHLGSRVSQAECLLNLLDEFDPENIFIIGDLYDDLNLNRLSKVHFSFLDKLRELSKKTNIVHILGNHDELLQYLGDFLGFKVVPEYIWENKGKRILLIHGHQFDRYITEKPFLTYIASLIYLFFQSIDENQLLARVLKRAMKKYLRLSKEIAAKLVLVAKKRDVDIVIFGHTHEPMDEIIEGVRIINDGCVTDIPSTCVICEYSGEMYLHEMNKPKI